MLFKRKKKTKPYHVDTSQKGFEYVGIKLTDEQYQDLCDLNLLWIGNENRKLSPAFHILVLMKILGLLPPEMIYDSGSNDAGDDGGNNCKELLQRKFGRIRS